MPVETVPLPVRHRRRSRVLTCEGPHGRSAQPATGDHGVR